MNRLPAKRDTRVPVYTLWVGVIGLSAATAIAAPSTSVSVVRLASDATVLAPSIPSASTGVWPILLAQAATDCKGCGEVTAVREVEVTGKGSGVGIGMGAVVGGILGNKVGGGTGRTVATVGGAAAGGYVGNEIEKRVNKDTQYEVIVRMQSGKTRIFRFDQKPHWETGDLVKVVNGALTERAE